MTKITVSRVNKEFDRFCHGQSLDHPLLHIEGVDNFPRRMVLRELRRLLELRETYRRSGDLDAYVFLHRPKFRWDACLMLGVRELTPEYLTLLGRLWCLNGVYRATMSIIWPYLHLPEIRHMMTDDEQSFLESIPDGTPLYRAAAPYPDAGSSWTLNRAVSEDYAKLYGKVPIVTTAYRRDDAVLYFARAGEDEVIMRNVRGFQIVEDYAAIGHGLRSCDH